MSGVNENEMVNFVELTRDNSVDVRFLEFMPFDGNKWSRDKMVPYSTMVANIKRLYPNLKRLSNTRSDTAKSYAVPGYAGRIGFITSMSDHFCGGCNRLRITADGHLKACLFGANEVNLRDSMRSGVSNDELLNVISAAVKRKPPRHGSMDSLKTTKNRPMILIVYPSEHLHNRVFPSCSNTKESSCLPKSTLSVNRLCQRHFSSSAAVPTKSEFKSIDAINMATVSGKKHTRRIARAVAIVSLPKRTVRMIVNGHLPKVTSLNTLVAAVQLAGVNAVKKTPDLLALCHPIPISAVDIKVGLNEAQSCFKIESIVTADGAVTGVEMEALVAVSVSSMTLYDLAKSAGSQNIVIERLQLIEKRGGKSDYDKVVDF